jgi:hypothetical protein
VGRGVAEAHASLVAHDGRLSHQQPSHRSDTRLGAFADTYALAGASVQHISR